MNKNTPKNVRKTIESLQHELKVQENLLLQLEVSCNHKWSDVKYDPVINKGYSIPARTPLNYDDLPYAMGVTVSDEKKDRWSRTCQVCEKVEYTSSYDEQKTINKKPKF